MFAQSLLDLCRFTTMCRMMLMSARFTLAVLLMVAAAVSHASAETSIEGMVPLSGKPMSPPPDARYALKAGQVAPSPRQLAVVYLEGSFSKGPPEKPVVMEQNGYQFSPGVLAVQTGTQIVFPNRDEDYHNVFSYSKTKRFDLGRFRKDETPPALVFDKAGIVRLYCEIHGHMRGIILVVDTPHFATTAGNGQFKLGGLPAGNFKLKAWLDEKTTLEQPVSLKPGQTLRVEFPGGKLAASR
jgi:plastocyanin